MTNHVITVDFETYYDSDYTLTKLPTQAYVFDPRFEVIGVGWQLDAEEPKWLQGGVMNVGYDARLFYDLPWEESTVVAHNAQFDGLVLEEKLNLHPGNYFCTMMAAKPIMSHLTGSVSLAACVEELGIGLKGTEVYDAKSKRRKDFTAEELADYAEYCKNDVRLTYILYQVFLAWYEQMEKQQ